MIIGIIGGGQLGMMMAEEAKILGHSVIGLDPNPTCSLHTVADSILVAEYNDITQIDYLASKCDVLTYEFENVDVELIDKHIDKIPQKSAALYYSRNRIVEKKYARSLGIPTPNFKEVESISDIFVPSIIKTITGGYDGKGQYKIMYKTDIDQIKDINREKWICEEYIDFEYEISVVATRDTNKTVVHFPVPINIHRDGILWQSIIGDEISQVVIQKAKEYTTRIITDLDYVGTLAVEYFVRNNHVIFNEFAPRPHNSGHYTIEGCNVSQFKNHILAITGDEVVKPVLLRNSVMINELGEDEAYVDRINTTHCVHHNYHKETRRTKRKMGHITCTHSSFQELQNIRLHILGDINE